METIRTIVYYGDFFTSFYESVPEKVRAKIDYVLFLLTVTQNIPKKYFKHVTDTNGLYEIRVEYESNIFRIFCCFDEGKIIVLFNGFQKKSQKTPTNEIQKAVKMMKSYFEFKSLKK